MCAGGTNADRHRVQRGWGDAARKCAWFVHTTGPHPIQLSTAPRPSGCMAEEAVADRRRRAHPRRERSIGGTRKGSEVPERASSAAYRRISSGFNTPNLGGCLCHDTHREAFSRSARLSSTRHTSGVRTPAHPGHACAGLPTPPPPDANPSLGLAGPLCAHTPHGGVGGRGGREDRERHTHR